MAGTAGRGQGVLAEGDGSTWTLELVCGTVCPNPDALTSPVKRSLWVLPENKRYSFS